MVRDTSYSRRMTLALSASLMATLSGCLYTEIRGVPDLQIANTSGSPIQIKVKVENSATHETVLLDRVKLISYDPSRHAESSSGDWEVGYPNPITTSDPHKITVNVKDGPANSKMYEGESGNGVVNRGNYSISVVFNESMEIEFSGGKHTPMEKNLTGYHETLLNWVNWLSLNGN